MEQNSLKVAPVRFLFLGSVYISLRTVQVLDGCLFKVVQCTDERQKMIKDFAGFLSNRVSLLHKGKGYVWQVSAIVANEDTFYGKGSSLKNKLLHRKQIFSCQNTPPLAMEAHTLSRYRPCRYNCFSRRRVYTFVASFVERGSYLSYFIGNLSALCGKRT